MRHLVVIITICMLSFTRVAAQEEPEYRAEIGVGAGLMTYFGDFNGSLTKNMQPAFSLVSRYKFNPRMALAMSVTHGKLKGTSDNTETWYPETSDKTIEFNNATTDIGLRFEYNFWPYGTGREYRGARPFTPYVAMGLGTTIAKTQEKSVFTARLEPE